MPIREDLKHFYGRTWRQETRPRIIERAGDWCEQCLAPNRALLIRDHVNYPGWWFSMGGASHNNRGELKGWVRGSEFPIFENAREGAHFVRIVLTVAHLNHTPGDDRDENLKALCQWCHLNYDQAEHKRNARTTRTARKDAERPLLQEMIA